MLANTVSMIRDFVGTALTLSLSHEYHAELGCSDGALVHRVRHDAASRPVARTRAVRDRVINLGHKTADKANELRDQAARKLHDMTLGPPVDK
jgi:hypothetical protein